MAKSNARASSTKLRQVLPVLKSKAGGKAGPVATKTGQANDYHAPSPGKPLPTREQVLRSVPRKDPPRMTADERVSKLVGQKANKDRLAAMPASPHPAPAATGRGSGRPPVTPGAKRRPRRVAVVGVG